MKDAIKQLILEFQEWDMPRPFPRVLDIPSFPKQIRKAHVFVGMRRSGKTWMMHQLIHQKIDEGLDKRKILYLNFEDERLISFRTTDFQSILEAYFDLYPSLVDSSDIVIFFDEIHIIEGWEKYIRRLLDQEKMQIFVTGSSAKMLSTEIATNLRGRAWVQEVFPCSFKEYVVFKKIPSGPTFTVKNASQLRQAANDYLVYGGFPETLFLSKNFHNTLIQGYMDSVVFRDVVDRHHISNTHLVKLFLFSCLQQLAAPLSVTKMFNRLKSQGEVVGKNSLYEYLDYLEDAYALFRVPLFHFSENVRQVNPQKLYAVDPGVISAYSIKPTFEKGAQLENGVFIELRRQYKDIFYYKTDKGFEVDFLVLTPIGEMQLIQVCLDFSSISTVERELRALKDAAGELNLKEVTIITLDTEKKWKEGGITFRIIPYWKWCLLGK